jgi:hypothetical protein
LIKRPEALTMPANDKSSDPHRLDAVVAEARRNREQREQDYRERALKLYPWICGRCGREFNRQNLHELTVHHKNHNHDHNPLDGSNWELLCLYCHDNEHQRQLEAGSGTAGPGGGQKGQVTHNPFADLKQLLSSKDRE